MSVAICVVRILRGEKASMAKFKIICPECGAVVITASPESLIWERCPGCRHHVWDTYDALMADVYAPNKEGIDAYGPSA